MKRFLLLCTLASCVLINASNHLDKRIIKLTKPYAHAIEFINNIDPVCLISDELIAQFFDENKLNERKDVKKLDKTLSEIKRLIASKKMTNLESDRICLVVDNLDKVKHFILEHTPTYYALTMYNHIHSYYDKIDEKNEAIVHEIMMQSYKLGLPAMKGRGLYHFVKKINIDLCQLRTLFEENIISTDLAININQERMKLVKLKKKIVLTQDYTSQRSKTRWLKAFGVLLGSAAVVAVAYGAAIITAVSVGL